MASKETEDGPWIIGRCEKVNFQPIFTGHISKFAYVHVWKNKKKIKSIRSLEVPAHFESEYLCLLIDESLNWRWEERNISALEP